MELLDFSQLIPTIWTSGDLSHCHQIVKRRKDKSFANLTLVGRFSRGVSFTIKNAEKTCSVNRSHIRRCYDIISAGIEITLSSLEKEDL